MMKPFLRVAALLGIAWSFFQLYTAWAGFYPEMVQRPLHVVFALSLAFLIFPARRKRAAREEGQTFWGNVAWYDVLLSSLALLGGLQLVWNYERLITRIQFVDPLHPLDIAAAFLLIALTLEACRRVVGWSLPAIAGIFLTYQLIGPWVPGVLKHGGISWTDLAEQQGLSVQGLFGIPTGVCSNYVFYFILFAAFMEVSGGGNSLSTWLFASRAGDEEGRPKGPSSVPA